MVVVASWLDSVKLVAFLSHSPDLSRTKSILLEDFFQSTYIDISEMQKAEGVEDAN